MSAFLRNTTGTPFCEVIEPLIGYYSIVIQISDDYSAMEVDSFMILSPDFLRELLLNLNNKNHMKFSVHSQRNQTEGIIKDFLSELHKRSGRYFKIIEHRSGSVVGTFTIKPYSKLHCEVGILIFSKYANHGIASKIWCSLPDLLSWYGYKFLIAGTQIRNMPMRRIMEKSGMTLDTSRNFPDNMDSDPKNIYFISQID